MLYLKETLVKVSAILAIAATPKLAIALVADPVLAQSSAPSTPLPSSLPSGTIVKVDGSSSMTVIDEALKKRFEEKFPGTKVDLAASGTDKALKALLKDDINLAAVGRPLTKQQKAQGLIATPISREKIAIIVGADNPFRGSLTFEQFAKIFRGEITNWSQVGGSVRPIRFIDRPNSSDTRRALSNYKVFKVAKFATGTSAIQVPQDDTAAVVRKLGKDGISYAVASQVSNQHNVRVLPMHNTLLNNPHYPYSQPRSYVHKRHPAPGTLAFLGFVTSKAGQDVRAATAKSVTAGKAVAALSPLRSTEVAASPSPTTASPESAATATQSSGGIPWWCWLLLPLLGGVLWWLLRGIRDESAETSVAPIEGTDAAIGAAAMAGRSPNSRLTLVPRNCREAYAHWEVPQAEKDALKQQGGQRLMLRLYDATDIDIDRQFSHSIQHFDCDEREQDRQIPIQVDDRDYIAELGYVTADERWLQLTRSAPVRVPACTSTQDGIKVEETALAGGAVAAGAVAPLTTGHSWATLSAPTPAGSQSRIILTPRDDKSVYVYWEVPQAEKDALKRQGGQKLMLRLYDVTDTDMARQIPRVTQQFDCDEREQDRRIPIEVDNRVYVAELGYVMNDGRWLKLTTSSPLRVRLSHSTRGVAKTAGAMRYDRKLHD